MLHAQLVESALRLNCLLRETKVKKKTEEEGFEMSLTNLSSSQGAILLEIAI